MSAPRKEDRIAVIVGAGPAGLTAALEMLRHSDITPIVFETDTQVGGISKTIDYRGNRMDLGGHRFFSKSDWVMRWWQEILPVAEGQSESGKALRISYQGQRETSRPRSLAWHLPMPYCWCDGACRGFSIGADSSTTRSS